MNLLKTINHNFTQDFFEKGIFNNLISKIHYKSENKNFINPNQKADKIDLNSIHLIEFVPAFLKISFDSSGSNISSFNYKYFKGFMCNLKDAKSVEEYMSNQLGKNGKKLVIRRLKRLENCFDIAYETYYGNISKGECENLMQQLYSMIVKRFAQRGDIHSSLKNWEFYKNTTYQLILEKKACLSIITSNKEPIAISLDYLFEDIREGAISSYEIDYSKFGLGNIDILKKLDWCFNNGFSALNMRYGDYSYKRFWCNTVFDYKSYVLFNRNKIAQILVSFLVYLKNSTIAYMITNKERFIIITKLRSIFHKKSTNNTVNDSNLVFIETQEDDYLKEKKGIMIDLENEEYSFLKKLVYDFQYLHSAHYKSVAVYLIETENDIFYRITNNLANKYFSIEKQ